MFDKTHVSPVLMFGLPLLLAGGCVPMSEHNKLKQQFDQQEMYVRQHRDDVQKASRETTRVALIVQEKDLQIGKLETEKKRLENELGRANARASAAEKTVVARPVEAKPASHRPESATSVPAASPKAKDGVDSFGEFVVNPKTRGIVLDQAVLFPSGSATLKKGGQQLIAKLATQLKSSQYKNTKVRVEGHTDDSPISKTKGIKDNWELSGLRAQAVLHALEAEGINSSRLCFAGYSSHQPIASGKGTADKARNRRVELVLVAD